MKQRLKIIVQVPHPIKQGSFVELLRNQIDLDDGLQYDYSGLLKGIRLLFPNKPDLIINLTLM